jgi:hypothetical protein
MVRLPRACNWLGLLSGRPEKPPHPCISSLDPCDAGTGELDLCQAQGAKSVRLRISPEKRSALDALYVPAGVSAGPNPGLRARSEKPVAVRAAEAGLKRRNSTGHLFVLF